MKTNRVKTFLICAVLLSIIPLAGQAQILTSYQILSSNGGTDVVPTITNTATTSATVYTHGAGLVTGGPFGYDVTPSSWAMSLASAETGNDYVTLSISPNAGYVLNLTNLDLSGARLFPNTTTDVTVASESSVTGFGTQATDGTFTLTAGAFGSFSPNISLSNSFLNLNSPVEFRFYIYGGTSGDVGLPYDAANNPFNNPNGGPITIDGTAVSAVPEPSTWALLLGALLLLGFVQRRSRSISRHKQV